MTDAYYRQAARDAAIRAMLPLVPEQGWTLRALNRAAGTQAEVLFPGGPAELVEAYIDLATRDMVRAAAPALEGQRLSQKVRTLILTRLEQAEPDRRAVRRAVGVLALPGNTAVAAGCTARTVDAIWIAAGDTGTGFSWYSKRAILASVYTSTLLYWLREGRTRAEVEAFLDRRLAGVAQFGKFTAKAKKVLF